MFAEDSDIRGGAVSFADLERQEADRFARLLAEVDDRLYTPLAPASKAVPTEQREEDGVRRYYSEGYEANYEGVSDDEIRQWQQSSFSYLRVEGTGINVKSTDLPHPESLFKRDDSEDKEHIFQELDGLPSQDHGLVMCGRSVAPPNGYTFAKPIAEDEGPTEEYFAQHGILQEYIEYNGEERSHEKTNTVLDFHTLDPAESQKEEVLATMMDAIWPDIVQALRPLVTDVLTAAKDNNIPYKVDQSPAPLLNEYGDEGGGGGFDFASDDGW